MAINKIVDQLNKIEAEMKKAGFWAESPPDLQAKVATGEIKSFIDAPSFELWLQQIFIPNAREALEKNKLPSESHVGEIAQRQYDYHANDPKAKNLLSLLHEFDQLIQEYNNPKKDQQ